MSISLTSYRRIVALASGIILLLPVLSVRAALVNNGAPAQTVAPGAQNVLVMDVTLPPIAPDTVVAPASGVIQFREGDPIYDVKPAHKIRTNNLTTPTKVWIDRDGNGRYTGAHTAGSRVQLGHGDVDLALIPAQGLPGYSSTLRTNHIYRDNGSVVGHIDITDQKISSADAILSEWFTNQQMSGLTLYKVKQQNQLTLCPSGFALGDRVRVQSSANQNFIEIKGISATPAANGNSCVVLFEINTPYPYNYRFGENILRTSVNMDAAVTVVDDATGDKPTQTTKTLRVTSGTVRGIAVGDMFAVESVADPGPFIRYLVTSVSSYTGKIGVEVVTGVGNLLGGPYSLRDHAQTQSLSGTLTAALMSTERVKFSDRDGDANRDADETIYIDFDRSGTVSIDDERVTALVAEPILLGAPSDGDAGGRVNTAVQDTKWRRQSYTFLGELGAVGPDDKAYDVGDALIIDRDKDKFFQRDVLMTMAVDNSGTAVATTDVERVKVYLESNGQAGFQTNDTQLGVGAQRAGNNRRWDISPNRALTGTPRFYVVADIAAGAGDGKTLQFSLPFAAMFFSTSNTTQPPEVVTNAATQTIAVAGPPPPPPDGVAPRILTFERVALTATSVRYHFTTDEDSRSTLTCSSFPRGSVRFTPNNTFTRDGTIELTTLAPSTSYDCVFAVIDAVGNATTRNDARFTTLAAPDVTAPNLVVVDPPVIAARSVRFHFTTDEPARSAVDCVDPAASSVGAIENSLSQDITIEVAPLQPNTLYTCTITLTDAAGNRVPYPQTAFTTPQEPLAIVAGTIQVTPTHETSVVQWQTNRAATSGVEYVVQGEVLGNGVGDPTPITHHTMTLSGLRPLTTYQFTILSSEGGTLITSAPLTFTTLAAPPPGGPPPALVISVPHSSVTVDLERVLADGTSVATITITLRDASGSSVQNRTVDLRKINAVVAGIGTIVASHVSDGLGRVIFQQASVDADTFLYSAYVGSNIIGNVQVTFTPVAAGGGSSGGGGGGGVAPATPPEVIATFTQCTPLAPAACDEALARRLFGRIVLAVERSGEAFYRYPKDLKAYYLGRPSQAFSIMRFLGSGVSNRDVGRLFANFATPSPGDRAAFETKDKALAVRFAGQIVLQVEAHGEAYYIHPITLVGYYLGRPADAFRIMRELGLGISNRDLAKLELVSAPEGRR